MGTCQTYELQVSHNRFPNGWCTGVQILYKHLFLFLFVFLGISPSRRSLGSYAVGEIPLYFYVPMERFFDGTDGENSETQGGKGQIRNFF